jgi:hypothetical protein
MEIENQENFIMQKVILRCKKTINHRVFSRRMLNYVD